MMTRRQLTRALQRACVIQLPGWHIWRADMLYRRTNYFVQWLIFNTSALEVACYPHFALQALAEQISTVTLTLGDRVRDDHGGDLFLTAARWEQDATTLVEGIIDQIRPASREPLTERAIGAYLDRAAHQHVAALTARGIVAVAEGDIAHGRLLLAEAADAYRRMDVAWARVHERQLRVWLDTPAAELLSTLQEAAATGTVVLGLPPG